MSLATIGIGSLPQGINVKPTWFSIPTRTQPTNIASGRDMFWEFEALSHGTDPFLTASSNSVRKAQLPGPCTLELMRSTPSALQDYSDKSTLNTSRPVTSEQIAARELAEDYEKAILTLLTSHPSLEMLWLDEPILTHDTTSFDTVTAYLDAIRRRFPSLSLGVHACGAPQAEALTQLPVEWLSIDTWILDDEALSLLTTFSGHVAWGVVTTRTPTLKQQLRAKRARLPIRSRDAITTTCGLGTLSIRAAKDRLANLTWLASS